MKNKLSVAAVTAVATVAAAVPSFAASVVDYTSLATSVTDELTPAIAAALPIGGMILAIGIGWRMVHRFTK